LSAGRTSRLFDAEKNFPISPVHRSAKGIFESGAGVSGSIGKGIGALQQPSPRVIQGCRGQGKSTSRWRGDHRWRDAPGFLDTVFRIWSHHEFWLRSCLWLWLSPWHAVLASRPGSRSPTRSTGDFRRPQAGDGLRHEDRRGSLPGPEGVRREGRATVLRAPDPDGGFHGRRARFRPDEAVVVPAGEELRLGVKFGSTQAGHPL
jgi:hypothetical protein